MSITDHGLHILPSDSAAETWNLAFGAEERLLVHRDDLTCGPLRAYERLSEWTRMRQEFWNTVSPERAEYFRHTYDHSLVSGPPRTSARLRDASSIYIWAGSNLHDQLFFIFALDLIERSEADPAKIHLVPFEVRPHHYGRFITVGSSCIDELKDHPKPVRVTAGALKTGRRAWKAITSETPAALLHLVGAGTPTAPYILSNLLHRYPQRVSGLSLWDRMLLERASTKGPNAATVIGWVLCDTWDNGDGVGEQYLFHRLKKMAGVQNPEPLLILSGNSENCRGAEVALTELGRAVLDGCASAYPVNPIDEWIGGVHVSSETGNIWMSDGDTVRKMPVN